MNELQAFAAEVHKEASRGNIAVDVELDQISDTEVLACALTADGSPCVALTMSAPEDFSLDALELGLLMITRFAAEAGR
jgi:hypothetical protein